MKDLKLQPFRWEVIDEAGVEDGIQIQCWALDQHSKTHLLRIEDFTPSCFLELPSVIGTTYVTWFDHDIEEVMKRLIKKLGASSPIKYSFSYRPKLYYYQRDKKYPVIHLTFRTLKALNECSRVVSRPFAFGPKGSGKIQIWEHKITVLRKFLTRVNLSASQWFEVSAEKVSDKISTLDEEYLCSWKKVSPLSPEITSKWMTYPKILVFDIEAYSKNKRAFPVKSSSSDVCYMISCIIQRLGKPETRTRKVVIVGDCDLIPGVEVFKVEDELECIQSFAQIVRDEDPDIISGYNIHGFDYDYMNCRLERLMEEWGNLGRILGEKSEIESQSWTSSAYGHNEINILSCSGRISLDMMLIKRDYKLPKYDLGSVGMHFVGRSKHPIKPYDIFVAYEEFMMAKAEGKDTSKYQEAVKKMTTITRYCVEDSELTLDIAEKINIWIGSTEMSNIVDVGIMELYTRGQQIRCLSMIYHAAHRVGYVLDFHEPLNVVFNGGSVEKPDPGIEDEVPAYDVSSMYPSIIIRDNMDYTTFIPDKYEKYAKDEECNITEFDQFERPKSISDKLIEEDRVGVDEEIQGQLVHRKIRFVKKEIRLGVIPQILVGLLAARKRAKEMMKKVDPDSIEYTILDRRQNALKVTCNSFFGFLGAYIGKLPLIEAGMAITANGRQIVKDYKDYLRKTYEARIVYGDTDSVMPKFQLGDMSWKDKWAFWNRITGELSSMYPGINLELEKVMRIICFAPKMYAFLTYTSDGQLITDPKKMTAKGIILARRDGTPWVRSHYRKIILHILVTYSEQIEAMIASIEKTFSMILEAVEEMVSQRVNWEDLAKINEVGSNYKSPNYPMAVFANHLLQIGRPCQPGDRIRYVICDIPGETKIGKKMRSDDEYLESQETETPLKLDTKYYLENALQKKIDPLFQVGYERVLSKMAQVGYKPQSRKHFVGISDPVRMIIRALEDGTDLSSFYEWFQSNLQEMTIPKARVVIKRRPTLRIE